MDSKNKNKNIFSNRGYTSFSIAYGTFMKADHVFYQRDNFNKYSKAKNVWVISLTTLQYYYKLIANGYTKYNNKEILKRLSKRKC